MAASYTESYARKLNSNDVLLVEGANSYMFSRPIKDWRDKTIFITPKESIKEVQYQYGDMTFSMAFKDSTWFIGKDKVQQSAIDGVLSSLSNLQADDFIDSTISPKIMAAVMYAGVQIRFSFNKTTNKYNVQSSHSSQWFIIEPGKANQILKRKKEIVELSKK
jgi:predicted phage-related endonuclease